MIINLVIRFYYAFKYSWTGFKYAWRSQWAFRVELVIFIIAIPLSIYLSKTAVEFILMMGSVFILLITELINSAIETTVNRIGLEYHELSGLAKDLASAAMVLAGLNVVMTFGMIIFYRLIE